MGYEFDWGGESEIKCRCPFHDDNSPSLHINVEKRLFKCQTSGCGKQGDFITFMARALETTRAVVIADLSTRYVLDTSKIINSDTVERYHKRLPEAKVLVKALKDRGITDATIRKYRLGENKGRITIPIPNEAGSFVNIRQYLPGAPGAEKMRNTRGHGKVRLYPVEQLKYDIILLCGGEIKALAAASRLNKHNIGAVSATCGEGNWDASLSPAFKDKTVYVCMDIDAAGDAAANAHCTRLSRVAGWVGKVILPLDIDRHPHGDINDFIANGGRLKPLLAKTEPWTLPSQVPNEDEDPIECSLLQATNAKVAGRRLKLNAVVSSMDTVPFVIPKDVTVECPQDQKECALCPAMADVNFSLHPESIAILEMLAAPLSSQQAALMAGIGIPRSCPVCSFKVTSHHNVEDTRISPKLEITSRSADRVLQPAVCVGPGVILNESYELVGRLHPHPKTQQSTLLISTYELTEDALSSYKCLDLDELALFQPRAWDVESIGQKLDELYEDLEANVTRIYQRRNLHLAVDLAYHSPLLLNFDGRTVKGWTEVLVLGDSAQGKSETAMNLQRHYQLGEKVECKNASVAGLLGGLQQSGARWFVTWGIIPTHDKRLVIMEEVKGASTEILAKLTDMRSSGMAEIPKIEKRRTHARTRLLALSNPRGDMQLSAYNFGVEAVKELIGGLEDVRRFDYALLLGADDIDPTTLNRLQRQRPTLDHTHTSDLCRRLVLWTWTRTEGQVVFEDEAQLAALDEATKLSSEFSERIPLIDRGSTRFKIARLAAALAGRTFSHGEDKTTLLVRKCHVEYIAKTLRETYSSSTSGYKDFSDAIATTQELIDPKAIKQRINETPFPRDFCEAIKARNRIELRDLQDWCAWDQQQSQQLLSFLVRKHALRRDGRTYRKTPSFIKLLKDFVVSDDIADRPDFINEIEEEF
jgi:hypothetical protein